MSPKKEAASQDFLDANQYSRDSILRYERIFGHTWVSTGGETTTKVSRVLPYNHEDVGCGLAARSLLLGHTHTLVEPWRNNTILPPRVERVSHFIGSA